jgi:hypothetical protein
VTSGEHSSRLPRLYVTWYRCVTDELDHAVTDQAFAHGVTLHEGRYGALCGHEVFIDSCLVPPGRSCVACFALVRLLQRPANPVAESARHREPSRWRRLFARLQTPAVLPPRPSLSVRLIPEQGGRTMTSVGTGDAPTAPVPADHHTRRGAR